MTPSRGFAPDPMGATPPDPDYMLALRARHGPPEDIRMHQIHFAPGPAPDPAGGAHDAPQTPSRMGYTPPHTRPRSTPSASRSRRLRRLLVCPQLIFCSRAPARTYLVLFPR